MNTVNLIGRLAADVELKYAGPTAVVAFTVAVRSRFKDKTTGENKTDFIRCKAFNKTAEIVSNSFKQGSLIGIEGSIQTGSYENKEGQKVFTTDIIVNNVTFLEKKQPQQQQPQGQPVYNQPQGQPVYNQQYQAQQPMAAFGQQPPFIEVSDEDLPF